MTIITPDQVQCGDVVAINGVAGIVKMIDGPDQAGAYDFYLTDGVTDSHKVITDPVAILPN